jgi:protein-disulfide isomerase
MTTLRRLVDARDHVRGGRDATVTLLEYGDLECPACGQAYWEIKALEHELGDAVKFVFRHFPLTQMHPHAMQAAEAAEAAGAQGRFWEMHDVLFEHQGNLDAPALMTYAAELDLDLPQFSRDLHQHRFMTAIRRQFMEGVRSGVNGTPTLFLNGVRYDDIVSYGMMREVVSDVLDAQRGGVQPGAADA